MAGSVTLLLQRKKSVAANRHHLSMHRAPIPEEEPLPGEEPSPEEDDPVPHPDPVINRPRPATVDMSILQDFPDHCLRWPTRNTDRRRTAIMH